MPFNVNDNLPPETSTNSLVSAVNMLASQVKRLLGGTSWKDAPTASITELSTPIKGDKGDKGDTGEQGLQGLKGDTGDPGIYKSSVAPVNPPVGMYWDELSSTGVPIAELFWNGLYWLERSPRFLNISGSGGNPAAVPWLDTSSVILIEKFITVTTGGEFNSTTNYYEYRLMNGNSANAAFGITIASNFSKSASGRREYSVDVNTVYLSKPVSLAVWGFKNGTTNENLGYSGHVIRYRLGRN